jgi:hypothetical protein
VSDCDAYIHTHTHTYTHTQVSEQLIKKQEHLDSALCEKYALEARLKSTEDRARELETHIHTHTHTHSADGDEDESDLESPAFRVRAAYNKQAHTHTHTHTPPSSYLLPSSSSSSFLRNRRKHTHTRTFSRAFPFLQQHPPLAEAADALDRFLSVCVYYFRHVPLLRVCVCVYVCVLHLWVFWVVGFHVERMEEMHGDLGGSVGVGV